MCESRLVKKKKVKRWCAIEYAQLRGGFRRLNWAGKEKRLGLVSNSIDEVGIHFKALIVSTVF